MGIRTAVDMSSENEFPPVNSARDNHFPYTDSPRLKMTPLEVFKFHTGSEVAHIQ